MAQGAHVFLALLLFLVILTSMTSYSNILQDCTTVFSVAYFSETFLGFLGHQKVICFEVAVLVLQSTFLSLLSVQKLTGVLCNSLALFHSLGKEDFFGLPFPISALSLFSSV